MSMEEGMGVPFSGNYSMGYHTMRIPAMIVTTSGVIVAFAEARRNGPRDFGDIDLVCRRSVDSGRTWDDLRVVHAEPGEVTIGNPVPIYDPHNGRIVLLCTRNNERAFVTYSDDEGTSFSSPVEISASFEPFRDRFPYVRIATGPCHGLLTSTGRMVVPVWLSDRNFARVSESTYRAGVIYSDDRGETWHAGGIVPPVFDMASEGSVCELSDGRLMLNLRVSYTGYRGTTTSDDGGLSWSEPELERDLLDPTCQGSILSISRGAGRVIAFSNLATGGPHTRESVPARKNLTVRLSRDDCRSWYASETVCSGFSGYSDLAFHGDSLFVLFENGVEHYHERISCVEIELSSISE